MALRRFSEFNEKITPSLKNNGQKLGKIIVNKGWASAEANDKMKGLEKWKTPFAPTYTYCLRCWIFRYRIRPSD
jgi:hypothetical protein